MALTKCKECKKEVSDKAEYCPHCGIKKPWLSFAQEKMIRAYHEHKEKEKLHAKKYQIYYDQMDDNLIMSLLNRSRNKSLREKVDYHVSQADRHQSAALDLLKKIDCIYSISEL